MKDVIWTENKDIWYCNRISKFTNARGLLKKDTNTKATASGLVSLYNGLSLSKMLGISEILNKRTWLDTVRAIFDGVS